MRKSRVLVGALSACLFARASLPLIASVNFDPIKSAQSEQALVVVTFPVAATLGSVAVRTQGVENLDFTGTRKGSCKIGKFYARHAFCTVKVNFSPLYVGPRYGAVVLGDRSGRVIATTYLQGTGLGVQAASPQQLNTTIAPQTNTVIGGFKAPDGIAVDEAGNLYVADYNACALYKVTLAPDGSYTSTTVASGLPNVRTVAVDGAGNVYSDGLSGIAKQALQPNGTYIQSAVGGWMGAPAGLAVDGSGNVYVSDSNFGQVYKHTLLPDGSYTRSTVRDGFHGALGVAVGGDGTLYIADQGDRKIYIEKPSGNQYVESSIDGPFTAPQGVALDGDGNVYVSDFATSSVYKETLAGISYIQSTVAANGGASYVAVDGAGNVYVSDVSQQRVMKIPFSALQTPPSEASPIPEINNPR